jgi:hypothetical protein
MPRTVSRKRKIVAVRTRQRFDAQIAFQLMRHEKRALASLIDGRRYKVLSDVLREAVYMLLEHNKINVGDFHDN